MAARGDGELFRSREAQLYIEEGEESVLMQSGEFALVLVQNAVSHLAAVVAMVGAVQWPVGRDCVVTRTGEGSFSFSLPGLLCYSLILKGTASAADLQRLEKVLEDYSTWRPAPDQHPAAVAAGEQEKEGLKQAEKRVQICRDGGESRKRFGDDLMVGRLQRARRMSAIAKVFYKSLERGAINMANHVQPLDLDFLTQDSRSSSFNFALAGVDAVAKVVEAVETGGRTLLESALSMAATEPSSVQGSSAGFSHGSSGLICSDWTLNKHGLLMLYRVITASMAMHSGLSSRSGSSRSGSSSSSEIRRLLSSSSSSSSLSSKSFVTPAPHAQAGADSRGSDSTSILAALPLPAAGTAPFPCPPPPPLFAAYTPRSRMSDMPPPSSPVPPPRPPPPPPPLPGLPPESPVSSSFRVYKPRPTPPMPPPAGSPPFPPRPPRFQPPQN